MINIIISWLRIQAVLYQVWWNAGNSESCPKVQAGGHSSRTQALIFHCAAGSNQAARTRLTRTDPRDQWDGSSFLTVHLPETRDYLLCMLLFGKTKGNRLCLHLGTLYSFFFFNTKSSIALTRPIINHYFTDKLWKCDPAISSCKIFTAAGGNISFYLFRCMNFFKITRKAVVG